MKKWLILLMVMMFMPIVMAEQIEISPDNSTWQSIDTDFYGGSINDTSNQAWVHILNSSTTYYVRVKDTTTDWVYTSIKTNAGGINQVELAMMVGLAAMAFFFLWFSFNLKDNHFFLKLLLMFFALISILAMPNAVISGEDGDTGLIMLKIATWFFRIFLAYFVTYLFWHWVQKSEKFQEMIQKYRKGKEER